MNVLKFLQLLYKATGDNRHYFKLEESNDHLELVVYSGTKWCGYRIDEGDMNKTPEALVQEVLDLIRN